MLRVVQLAVSEIMSLEQVSMTITFVLLKNLETFMNLLTMNSAKSVQKFTFYIKGGGKMGVKNWYGICGNGHLSVYIIFEKAVNLSNFQIIDEMLKLFKVDASPSLKSNLINDAEIHDNNRKSVVIDINDVNDHYSNYFLSSRLN